MGRSRRIVLGIGGTLAVVAVAGTLVVRHLRADHVDRHGSVYVAVSGHEILMPWEDPGITVGTGGGGLLGLINDACVGFVHDPKIDALFRHEGHPPPRLQPHEGEVIIWPAGTAITGSGRALRISWHGREFRLGDRVEGGVAGSIRSSWSGFHDLLPAECRDADLVDFSFD